MLLLLSGRGGKTIAAAKKLAVAVEIDGTNEQRTAAGELVKTAAVVDTEAVAAEIAKLA
jgi:hypothetical protein